MRHLKKFTLLELLIVISVIGILITLLLPSLKSAREKSLSAVCKSNLKQIGVGVYLYSSDNTGYMPTNNINSSSPFSPGMVYYLSLYLDVTMHHDNPLLTDLSGTVFDEPLVDGEFNGGITYPVAAGYGWNWRYMGYKQTINADFFKPQFLNKILDPSERMLAGDTSDSTELEGNVYFRYQNVGERHQRKVNVLHGDGSSFSVTSAGLRSNNNSKWWFSDTAH